MKKIFIAIFAILMVSICFSAVGKTRSHCKVVGKFRVLTTYGRALVPTLEEHSIEWVLGNLYSHRFEDSKYQYEKMVRLELLDYGYITFDEARKNLRNNRKPASLDHLLSLVIEYPDEIHPYVAEQFSTLETKPIVALGFEWEYPVQGCDDPEINLSCATHKYVPIIYKDVDNGFDIDWMCSDGGSTEETPLIFLAVRRL
ncbi:hypothetical protein KKA95_04425 [Patescibacteria group bacterium]|nr:hypothetical protein [Patescibacteria group bacterium]